MGSARASVPAVQAATCQPGGQRQLVALGQALVRRPDVLLLDEPTSNLDLRNQLDVLHTVTRIARTRPAVVITVIHDLALAARFADRMIVLHEGRVHASGTPQKVLTPSMLAEVYRVEGEVHRTESGELSLTVSRSLPLEVPGRSPATVAT